VWLLLVLFFLPAATWGQEEEGEGFPGDESALDEEQDFPDLVRADETGGVMDEFAFLEEELPPEVIESASKHRQSIFWSPSAINVYTREDILVSGARSLPEFLRRVPGFDIYRLKPSYPLIGARALTEESNNLVLLLVNGREAMSEVLGTALWESLSFDLEDIERLEVIRGPGSTLYGANAFAAVVNVTTVPEKPIDQFRVSICGTEERGHRLIARLQESIDIGEANLSFAVGGALHQIGSPSYTGDLAVWQYRSNGWLRYRDGKTLDLSFHAGFNWGTDGLMYLSIADLRVTDALYYYFMGQGEFALGEGLKLKAQVYHLRHAGNFHYRTSLRGYDLWIGEFPDFTGFIPTLDGQVQLDWQIADQLLLIGGGNLRYTRVTGENIIIDGNEEVRGAGFASLQWSPLAVLQLTGGIRLDLNSFTDPAFSPRGVVVYHPWENHAFRLGYGLAFRKPSFFESKSHIEITNYNPATPEVVELGRTQFGNKDLGNEKVHSIELGWRGRFFDKRLSISLDTFFSMYRDSITFHVDVPTRLGAPDIANSTLRYENVGAEVDAIGGEVEAVWKPADAWSFFGNLGLRYVTEIESGDRAASEPVVRVNLGGHYSKDSGILAALSLHYVSEYKVALLDPRNILNPPDFSSLGNRILLLARVGYLVKHDSLSTEVGVTINTPLGTPFREYAGMVMPPYLVTDKPSDFGGEELHRLVSLYLRGSF
jgi:iron complex outermembrane receptor protein